jgi:catechol 2,3-dioxygenase
MQTSEAVNSQSKAAVKFAPRRLAHANLFVGELDRSTHFYNKVCGLELVRREPGIWATFLSGGTTHHDIACMQATPQVRIGVGGHVQIPQGRGQVAGLNHFGWEMENEALLVEAYKRAKGRVDIHRTTNHQISHSVYVFDPDGNLHEFYVDALHNWRSIFNLNDESLISGDWNPLGAPASGERMYAENPVSPKVEGAIFNPVCITHAIVVTKDFGKMREFFVNVGGLTPIEESEGRWVLLRGTAGRFDFALVDRSERLQPGVHALAFKLQDDIDLARCEARLREARVDVRRVVDESTKQGFVIADPDGLLLEFYRRKGESGRFSQTDVLPYLG